jgi:hypothetical protein
MPMLSLPAIAAGVAKAARHNAAPANAMGLIASVIAASCG